MAKKPLTREQILTMLAAAPPHIAALTTDMTPAQLRAAPGQDEWSANDVLAHLRSCPDVWGDCIVTILNQGRPTLRAVNPTTWIKTTDYPEQEFKPSLHAFTTQRAEFLTVLEPLAPKDWSRMATVTGAGKTLERSVHFYAQWLARHERSHWKQLEHILNTIRV